MMKTYRLKDGSSGGGGSGNGGSATNEMVRRFGKVVRNNGYFVGAFCDISPINSGFSQELVSLDFRLFWLV